MDSSLIANAADNDRRAFAQRVLSQMDGKEAGAGWPIVPYPGVRSFTGVEETIFFGRDEDINRVREKLTREHCVFVLGGSGSGKSSLVRAGVIPGLISGNPLHDRWGPWYALTFTPGKDPFESLARSLIDEIYGLSEWPTSRQNGSANQQLAASVQRLHAAKESIDRIFKKARAEPATDTRNIKDLATRLTEILRRRYQNNGEGLAEFLYSEIDRFHADFAGDPPSGGTSLIVIIDQFEEIFRNGIDPNSAQAFVRLMARLGSSKLPGLYVVATMRSEEVHRSVDYPELTGLIDRTAHFVDLPDPDKLFKAITSSARMVLQLAGFHRSDDVGIEVSVAERMLDAIGALAARRTQRSDQLPLMQNALRELWGHAAKRWADDPNGPLAITIDDLKHLPTISGADDVPDLAACLNNTANTALVEAATAFPDTVRPEDAKELLEVAFVRLEQPDDRGNPARAFATVDDMLRATGRPWPTGKSDLIRALDIFVKRTVLTRRMGADGEVFDVSHEAVIRNWDTYTRWLGDANRVRREIVRVLEAVWDKRSAPDAPTRFERGEWAPALSSKQTAVLITSDQSDLLQSVRPKIGGLQLHRNRDKGRLVSVIDNARRRYAKLSSNWVAATIVPAFESRWQKQFLSEKVDGAFVLQEAQTISEWFLDTIDSARRQHALRSVKSIGSLGMVLGFLIFGMAFWNLHTLDTFYDLQISSTDIVYSGYYWLNSQTDSKTRQETVDLISGLRNYNIGNVIFAPTSRHIDAYFRAIQNVDLIARTRLDLFEHSTLPISEAKGLPAAICKIVPNAKDDFSLLSNFEGHKRGVASFDRRNGVPSFLPVVERDGKLVAAGLLRETFTAPPDGIWCLSPAGETLLVWGREQLPYIVTMQWGSFLDASNEVHWLAKPGRPRDVLDQTNNIRNELRPLYESLVSAPEKLSSAIRVGSDDRMGFVIIGPDKDAVQLSFQSALQFPQRISKEIPSEWQSCRDSSESSVDGLVGGTDCLVDGFESNEKAVRYRVHLQRFAEDDGIVAFNGSGEVGIIPCTEDERAGLCRYQITVYLMFKNDSGNNIARFSYPDLLSRAISDVAVHDGYLWLRQTTEEGPSVVRFDFSLERMAKELQPLPSIENSTNSSLGE
jgi:hypothetical protein